jgi:hypothetical protein
MTTAVSTPSLPSGTWCRSFRCAGTAATRVEHPAQEDEWRSLYRRRSAVEREFGRLKHHYGLAMLRVCGIERVRLHADLTILGRLALELAKARALPVAA